MTDTPSAPAPSRRLGNTLQSFRRLIHRDASVSEIEKMKRRVDRAYEDWRASIQKGPRE